MIYFIVNISMYLIINIILVLYFKNKFNIFTFIIILFNLNISFFFIYKDINYIYFIFISLLSILFYNFIYVFNHNNKEIILIREGNINFHEVIENYSFNKLYLYLKLRNIKLDEINYCIKKNNHLIIIKNNEIKSFPVSIIIDGILRDENLKLIHKNKKWLQEELLNNHLLINMIDYAYYKKDKIYFIKKEKV